MREIVTSIIYNWELVLLITILVVSIPFVLSRYFPNIRALLLVKRTLKVILTNRIKSLIDADLIVLLDKNSTKKSRQYIATQKGISTLPIILELYMFSIKDINESVLNDQQIQIKKQIISNSENFINSKRIDYMAFKEDLLSKVIEHK